MASYTRTNARRPPAVVKHSRKLSAGEVVGGLDADLKARESTKRDAGLEGQAIAFLEALTGAEISDMLEDLKDGVILCNAINAISPKAVKRVNKSKMPFKQMENVSNFIKACRKLGVPEYALFTTPDLYDGKSVVNVTNGIVALGSKAQSLPGYSGPIIGAKNSTDAPGASTKKKMWEVKASGSGGATKMMNGSLGTMQRREILGGRQDMAKKIGAGTAGVTTKMMMGSLGTMDKPAVDRSNDITFGHDAGRPARKPPPPKPKRKLYKTAAWDYVPAEDDELAMTAGDKIEMIKAVDEDWAKGKNTRSGEVGLYPISYVE